MTQNQRLAVESYTFPTVVFSSSSSTVIAHKSNRTLLGLMYSDYRQLWLITILWGKQGLICSICSVNV